MSNTKIPDVGKLYKHYKNEKVYMVLGFCMHSEDEENLVLYQAIKEDPDKEKTVWARPVRMWFDRVTTPSGGTSFRFTEA